MFQNDLVLSHSETVQSMDCDVVDVMIDRLMRMQWTGSRTGCILYRRGIFVVMDICVVGGMIHRVLEQGVT